jgi:hypothetical protein
MESYDTGRTPDQSLSSGTGEIIFQNSVTLLGFIPALGHPFYDDDELAANNPGLSHKSPGPKQGTDWREKR